MEKSNRTSEEKMYEKVYTFNGDLSDPNMKLSAFNTGIPRFKSSEELEGRFKDYLLRCVDNDLPITVSGLAASIGTTREKLLEYQGWHKEAKTADEKTIWLQVSRIIGGALTICEQFAEENLFRKRANAQGVMFQMVNNFNWKNKVDISSSDIGAELEEIRSRYNELVPRFPKKISEPDQKNPEKNIPTVRDAQAESIPNQEEKI